MIDGEEKCPTEYAAETFECPTCNGRGCRECNDSGSFTLTSCAKKQIDNESWRMLKWVVRAEEHGMLPLGGGGLDQTQSFIDCWEFLSVELDRAKAAAQSRAFKGG